MPMAPFTAAVTAATASSNKLLLILPALPIAMGAAGSGDDAAGEAGAAGMAGLGLGEGWAPIISTGLSTTRVSGSKAGSGLLHRSVEQHRVLGTSSCYSSWSHRLQQTQRCRPIW